MRRSPPAFADCDRDHRQERELERNESCRPGLPVILGEVGRMTHATPVLDPRGEDAIAAALAVGAPAFAPSWRPGAVGPGTALIRVYARFLKALADRINAAPDKNRLAFFEQLGIELTPAQAARAPVVFIPLPNVGDSRIPARTRLGADAPDGGSPLVFETERAIALVAAPLAEVVTLWPGRDAYADHSARVLAGEPFTLFTPLRPVPHELYIAHAALAIAGESTVEFEIELSPAGADPLAVAWEHWDGEAWRAFKPFVDAAVAAERDSIDATAGLTRTGVVRLAADCGASKSVRMDGIEAMWVRGRLTEPLPPDGGVLPHVLRLHLRTTIDRSLPPFACASLPESVGLLPDDGYGGPTKLDFSKAVQPLGSQPQAGDAFHVACDDAFTRPGAEVTLCFAKVDTANEVIDQLGAEYEEDANNVQRVTLEAAIHAVRALLNAGRGVLAVVRRDNLPTLPDPLPAAYDELENAVNDLAAAITTAELELSDAIANDMGVDLEATLDPLVAPARAVAYWVHNVNTQTTASQPAAAPPPEPLPEPPLPEPPGATPPARHAGLEDPQPFDDPPIIGPDPEPGWPWSWGHTQFVDASASDLEDAAAAAPAEFAERLAVFIASNEARVRQAGTFSRNATSAANAGLERLDTLTPIDAVRAAGVRPPPMPEPVVAWEYWNGSRWRGMTVSGTPEARTFRGAGPLTFTVPADMDSVEVNGAVRRWLRARLVAGGYGTVRLVSWRDEKTQRLNFFPIVQVRPPTLENVRVGYRYQSPWVVPDHCVAFNDFGYTDHTADLRQRRDAFRPFAPVEDRTPALYLGFDGDLPADRIGVWAGIEEEIGVESGPQLVWEGWSGGSWERLDAHDGTRGLAVPGIATVLWPGAPTRLTARIIEARGAEVTAEDAQRAARFATGELVQVRQGADAELARVAAVDGRVVRLAAPLEKEYQGASLERARLPRFGTPRTWIRARLAADGPPRRTTLDMLRPNAVWASHAETIEAERLGSGTGQPDLVLFARSTPVLDGEVLEVRELEGGRAQVEEPVLRAELEAAGLRADDVLTEHDPRTGRPNAVWVRWRRRRSLLFAPAAAREFAMEHSRGRVLFGDGEHGRIPPAGRDNVRFRIYRAGGGVAGNVRAGDIGQVLAGVLGTVTNVRPAEGGAEVESLDRLRERAPTVLRHRSQAITAADYEALALQASPAVAVARALPDTHPGGRRAAGWVTVRIVPHSAEPRPVASFEVRRRVRRYIAARAPAAIAGQVAVLPAEYLAVGVSAVVHPLDTDAAGGVRDAVLDALRRFLHPLTGGPEGRGWPFGRDGHLSDVAAVLEAVPGVDYVAALALELGGSPVGDTAVVPRDRMVVAGPLRITLT